MTTSNMRCSLRRLFSGATSACFREGELRWINKGSEVQPGPCPYQWPSVPFHAYVFEIAEAPMLYESHKHASIGLTQPIVTEGLFGHVPSC